MALEKAFITPEGEERIAVLFNPPEYGLDKGNQIAEIGIPGLGSPILQYVRGNTSALTIELFFDTYEEQPPICTFTWGQFTFRFVVERVSGRFTLFLANGTPVRASLNLTFKEFVDVEVQVRQQPTESADHTKTHTLRPGNTLSSIAAAEYGDAARWRPIAEANNIDNPLHLEPGRVLVLPPLA